MKAIGYLRVSTSEQADSGLGIDAQRATIQSEADRRGWEVMWIVDEGYSGKSLTRPGMTEALRLLAAHEAEAIVTSKLDRLSRSVVDFANTLTLSRKQGWSVVLLDLGVDTTTPSGKLLAGVMAQFAEYERELIAQRTREALAAAKARGQRLGRPRSTPDAVVGEVVRLKSTGLSARQIAATLTTTAVPTTRGAATWRASSVRRVLNGHALDQHATAVLESDGSREGVN